MLEKASELRSGLLVFVVARPAFMPINILSALRAAVRHFEIFVGPVGALKIVVGWGRSGDVSRALGRRSGIRRPTHGYREEQNDNQGTRAQ
jgi:adenosine/AMP kinase